MGFLDHLRRRLAPPRPTTETVGGESAASILRRARRLRFRASPRAVSDLAGAYSSARPGFGLSFSELKPYEPGDDVRHIDWKVTARQRRPYVRRYLEERSLTVWLIVDVSASMRFGPEGRSKVDRAVQAAALLAAAAARIGDRVGLMLTTDRVEVELRPAAGPRHVAKLLRMLVASSASSKSSSLEAAAARVGAETRRALIVVLGDFLLPENESGAAWRRLARRNRIVAFRMVDPLERSLPDVGLIDTVDAETGRTLTVDTSSPLVRSAYAKDAEARRESFRAWCLKAGIEPVDFPTELDPLSPLLRYFASTDRGGRR